LITVTGNYDHSSTGALTIEIGGLTAVTQHDQLSVFGTATLDGALNVSLITPFVPAFLDQFTIIDNDGTDVIVGTFNDLPEGAVFTVGTSQFQISYFGVDGAGNDVVLTAINRPPIAEAGGPYSVAEGGTVQLDGSDSTDPDQDDATLTFQWDFDYDGNTFQVDATGATPTFDAANIDGTFSGTNRTIALRVIDLGGLSSLDTAAMTITNAAPTVNVDGPGNAVRGQTVFLSGGVADPGLLDTHVVTIDWGDGTIDTPTLDNGQFAGSHIFTVEGNYVVVVRAIDDDGGESSISQTVFVSVVAMQGVDLAVGGTTVDDHIHFTPGTNAGDIEVALNGVSLGTFQPSGRLLAFGQAGDDNIQVAGSISLSAWLYGVAGDDRLKGGDGHDVLLGGTGGDLLVGGSGRDLLIGGVGADRIVGNAHDDILVAGFTLFDYDTVGRLKASHERAMLDILSEWTSARSYETRILNLTDGSGSSDRTNGGTFLRTVGEDATIFEDTDDDVLTGSSGEDWFFFDKLRDRATDLKDEVFANDLEFILP